MRNRLEAPLLPPLPKGRGRNRKLTQMKKHIKKQPKDDSPIPPSPLERGLRGEAVSISGLPSVAKRLLETCADKKIVAFYGKMGAGKTTFIKTICETLGVTSVISSPTFSIVNEYSSASGTKIFHFDFYRINSISEAYDMGYEDYFYSGAYCFIEWPEKIEEILPPNFLKVNITVTTQEQRLIEWNPS